MAFVLTPQLFNSSKVLPQVVTSLQVATEVYTVLCSEETLVFPLGAKSLSCQSVTPEVVVVIIFFP